MKFSTRTIGALVRGILLNKKNNKEVVNTYLKCIPSIQKLVERHQLGINLKERHVVIDVQLHELFISTRVGKAMEKADRKYIAFFDKLIAYMNFQLGRMGKRDFIDPKTEPITFQVTIKQMVMWENNEPVPAHLQVREKTILVGYYKNGVINYKTVEDGPM